MNEEYWTKRYNEGQTGWDIGYASPQLIAAAEKHPKDTRILIPGAGNAYEAEALWKLGYKNTHVVDISKAPLDNLAQRVPDMPASQLIHSNFFELKGEFDVILEQTFYCALPPAMRDDYVRQMASLLPSGGMLTGLLFDFPLTEQGPPFGGDREEYKMRFSSLFEIIILETAPLSIEPRQGKEFYFELVKK